MILKLIVLMSTFLFSQDPCTCENDFNPVCGFDGFTYPNECMALCFGVSVNCSCTNQINCLPGEYQNENGDGYFSPPLIWEKMGTYLAHLVIQEEMATYLISFPNQLVSFPDPFFFQIH